MAENGATQFNGIYLAMRSGLNPGQLKVHPKGLIWRRSGGGKIVEVDRNDIVGITWTRVPRGYQLAVKQKAGSKVKLSGFREDDLKVLTPFIKSNFGKEPVDKMLSITGRNWGEAEIEGNMLSFNVAGKQAFEVNLADISQTALQGKNEVQLELHVDDTAGEHEVLAPVMPTMHQDFQEPLPTPSFEDSSCFSPESSTWCWRRLLQDCQRRSKLSEDRSRDSFAMGV